MTTRQYARLVSEWIGSIGLDPKLFGTHSLRRTKATLIYRRTGNLRAVQLLLREDRDLMQLRSAALPSARQWRLPRRYERTPLKSGHPTNTV